jgi:hypothetical protein
MLVRLEIFSGFRPATEGKNGATLSLRSPVINKTQFLSSREVFFLDSEVFEGGTCC